MSRPAASTIVGRNGSRRRGPGRFPALVLSLLLSCPALAGEVPVSLKLQPAEITPAATGAMILSAARAGKRIVAVGNHGIVLLSDTDGGSSGRRRRSRYARR